MQGIVLKGCYTEGFGIDFRNSELAEVPQVTKGLKYEKKGAEPLGHFNKNYFLKKDLELILNGTGSQCNENLPV